MIERIQVSYEHCLEVYCDPVGYEEESSYEEEDFSVDFEIKANEPGCIFDPIKQSQMNIGIDCQGVDHDRRKEN